MSTEAVIPHVETAAEIEAKVYVAPQWKLVWWKFRKHKLALISGVIVILIYLVALFVEFLAPFPPTQTNSKYLYAPPQKLYLFDDQGKFSPMVNGYISKVDPVALRRTFEVDPAQRIPVRFFVKGYEYKLFGIFPANVHLFGPVDPTQPMYLLGADRLGRDLLSRLITGTRISMSIGLIGVILSLVLGILLGGISGYYGGTVDNIIQRVIEFLRSIPSIPLWLGLAAALPPSMPPLQVYFGITIILSLIGWTGLARVVRGKILQLREEDYALAARGAGASDWRIITRHLLPGFTSHLIVSITFNIPGMILSETALSFIGLGMQPPAVSWGVLLQDAQNLMAVAQQSWLMIPAIWVIGTVLMFNFVGDGLRDAADPYNR